MTMHNSTMTLEESLKQLLQTTNDIGLLDLQEEANDSLLLSLQNRQKELREAISMSGQTSYTELERHLLAECLRVEADNVLKLESMRTELANRIRMIDSGKRTRNAYQTDQAAMSYFIDQHQ